MQTTTPKLSNMAPVTGRMVNEEDEIHNIVDDYGSLKVVGIEHTAVHAGHSFTYAGAANNIVTGASACTHFSPGTKSIKRPRVFAPAATASQVLAAWLGRYGVATPGSLGRGTLSNAWRRRIIAQRTPQ